MKTVFGPGQYQGTGEGGAKDFIAAFALQSQGLHRLGNNPAVANELKQRAQQGQAAPTPPGR